MPREYTNPAQISTTTRQLPNWPRVCHVVERGGVVLTKSEQRNIWRPGEPPPKGAPPSALSALERHAEEAARRGVYASERGTDRRAA